MSIHSQIVNKKDFRLKDNKAFLLNTETKSRSNTFALRSENKNLLAAGILSFVIPGAALGQFYKDEPVNGAIRVGISVLCAVWFLVSPPVSFHGSSSNQKLFALGAYAVNWIASIIDASYNSKKTEKKKPPRGIYKFGF